MFLSCSHLNYNKTVSKVEIDKFMGKWFVIAGKFTFLEKEAYNSVEIYHWNKNENRIDIDFKFNKNSPDGEVKNIPQKGWIYNSETNAHWKVSPFWPLKFDYLIIDLAKDYSWTVIGVPDGKYLWIMAREPNLNKNTINHILLRLENNGYPTNNLKYIKHTVSN